jgi:toxin FitB
VTTPTDSNNLVLVDSSGWVEFFGDGPKAEAYAPFFEREETIVLPTIVIFEVRKKLERDAGESVSARFLSCALRTRIVPLDAELAVAAASVALQMRLPMADAIIYATARGTQAELITQDSHFQGLQGVTLL